MNTTDSHDTTYGRALAYAADAIRRGDNSAAITLLTPYTDAAHDPVTYHSAYRLLYPLAPNDTLRDRLIAAAIQGDNNSYTIIADTLATLDPAILPADNILPLVRRHTAAATTAACSTSPAASPYTTPITRTSSITTISPHWLWTKPARAKTPCFSYRNCARITQNIPA